jgi:hypothetical protein
MNLSFASQKFLLVVFVLTIGFSSTHNGYGDDAVPFVSMTLEEGQSSEPIELDQFRWMAGSWEGSGLGGECVETWSVPKGNAMVGSFLYAQADKTIFSEHFVILKVGDSITLKLKHFDDKLSGWEEKDKFVEFKFVKREGDRFHFNGLTYVRKGENEMEAFVRMKGKDGKASEIKFAFQRVGSKGS